MLLGDPIHRRLIHCIDSCIALFAILNRVLHKSVDTTVHFLYRNNVYIINCITDHTQTINLQQSY